MFLAINFNSFEPWLWLLIFAITLILELITIDLFCIWFSIGSLISFALEAFNVKFGIQILVFLVVSCVLLFTAGKWARDSLKGKNATNIDALIGQEIIILKDTSKTMIGEGKINGIIWSTICIDNETIKKGNEAVIVEINGNKLYVKSK